MPRGDINRASKSASQHRPGPGDYNLNNSTLKKVGGIISNSPKIMEKQYNTPGVG